MADKRILFIHPGMSTFVRQDFEFLLMEFEVRDFFYRPSKSLMQNLWQQTRLLFWLIYRIWWCDSVFIWFADYHSALPVFFSKLWRKKSIIVIGGYEVSYFPKIRYGSRSNPFRFFFTKYSIKNTGMNLSVSNFVDSELKKIFGDVHSTMIYNGVQKPRVFNHEATRKGFLTVSVCRDEQRFSLKGIDLFIEAATHFPNEKFVVVGISQEFISQKMDIPGNVSIFPPVPSDELVEFYSRTKYYCQFSMVESFGLAVAEAMAYGCIPVVVDRGALKEVVEKYGVIVKEREIQDVVNGIRFAVDNDWDENGIKNFTAKNFASEKRKSSILNLINSDQ